MGGQPGAPGAALLLDPGRLAACCLQPRQLPHGQSPHSHHPCRCPAPACPARRCRWGRGCTRGGPPACGRSWRCAPPPRPPASPLARAASTAGACLHAGPSSRTAWWLSTGGGRQGQRTLKRLAGFRTAWRAAEQALEGRRPALLSRRPPRPPPTHLPRPLCRRGELVRASVAEARERRYRAQASRGCSSALTCLCRRVPAPLPATQHAADPPTRPAPAPCLLLHTPLHPLEPPLLQGRDCYLYNLDDQHVLDSTEAGALCRFTVGWLGRPGWLCGVEAGTAWCATWSIG